MGKPQIFKAHKPLFSLLAFSLVKTFLGCRKLCTNLLGFHCHPPGVGFSCSLFLPVVSPCELQAPVLCLCSQVCGLQDPSGNNPRYSQEKEQSALEGLIYLLLFEETQHIDRKQTKQMDVLHCTLQSLG